MYSESDDDNYFEDKEICLDCKELDDCFLVRYIYVLDRIYYGYCPKCTDKWYHTNLSFSTWPTLRCEVFYGWLRFEKRREKEVKRLLCLLFYKDIGTLISNMMVEDKKMIRL